MVKSWWWTGNFGPAYPTFSRPGTCWASQYAWFAAENALFGGLKRWNADLSVFPSVIYTDPEVARVGL